MATLSIKNSRLKRPTHSKTNILTLYSPRSFYIEKADTRIIDTEIVLDFSVSKFKGQKIETMVRPKIQRLWLTLLNKSYFDRHQIKRKDIIGYLIFELNNLKIYYEKEKKPPTAKTRKLRDNYFPKEWEKNGKSTGRIKQVGGFLNRYDFAYAGRDTVNQVGKIAPGIINKATSNINKTAQQRIDQAIKTGGAEVERIAPKIIRGATEDVYKTPFRLLGNFGKKQLQKIKSKLFRK